MPLVPSDPEAVKKHGDSLSTPMLLDGASLSYDGNGLRVLNCSFLVRDQESPGKLETANLPQIGNEIFPGSKLYVSKLTKRYNRDLTITAEYEAIGIDPAYGETTEICIEGASVAGAEPIETHPEFTDKLAGTKAAPLNGAVFDDVGKFQGFSTDTSNSRITSEEPLAGTRSYLAPKDTARCYFHTTNDELISNTWLIKTGTQSTNSVWNRVRLVPAWWSGDTSSLLLTSVSVENLVVKKGGGPVLVKISYELMSGAGSYGWNDIIYPKV